jgi:argininosuccinate synthase
LVEIAAIEQTTLVAHGYPAADRSVATAVKSLDASMTVVPVPQSVLGPAGPPFAGTVSERRSEPATVELTFARGAPTAINGILMPMIDLIGSLDMLSPAPGSRKNRRGTTAVMVMHDAHRALQESVAAVNGDGRRYAQLIAEGAWFSSERKALDKAVDRAEQAVTGTVRLQLVNDKCRVVEITPADTRTTLNVTTLK